MSIEVIQSLSLCISCLDYINSVIPEDSSPEDLKSPVVTTESKPSLSSSAFVSTFSVAENLNCYNQPIEFHQVMFNYKWYRLPCKNPTVLLFIVRVWETNTGSSIITWELRKCSIVMRAWPTPRMGTSASWTTWSPSWRGGRAQSPSRSMLLAQISMTLWTPSSISVIVLSQTLWDILQLFMFFSTWATFPPQYPDTRHSSRRFGVTISVHE